MITGAEQIIAVTGIQMTLCLFVIIITSLMNWLKGIPNCLHNKFNVNIIIKIKVPIITILNIMVPISSNDSGGLINVIINIIISHVISIILKISNSDLLPNVDILF